MRLNILHGTHYRYAESVAPLPHTLVVTPRESGQTRIIHRSLRCVPDADVAWTLDVFGNLIATATFAEPTRDLVVTGEAVVDHGAPEWPVFAIDPEMDEKREDRIRRRAHQFWEQAGSPHGQHEEHWSAAAREVDAEETMSAGKSPMSDPGSPGGTSGTGGTNHKQDR
jgi:transglutaminase-like putative cysteine protease